jgi:DnaK suppressor protein
MTKNQLKEFQTLLKTRVDELERLVRHRDAITIVRSADQLEEIQQASERALAVSNLDRDSIQLRDVRGALRRIQEGSFGTCEECDEEIHPKRLAAVPWAPLCIRCQESADREAGGTPRGSIFARAA